MTIAKISLAFVAFGMFFTGYYVGYTWHQIGDPQPWDDFNVQVMMPAAAIVLLVAWIVVG
jgi:hypothetical protein